MPADAVLQEWAKKQGWDTDSQLSLALKYIEYQQDDQAWENFLAREADFENVDTDVDDGELGEPVG